jgi:predicted deacylase
MKYALIFLFFAQSVFAGDLTFNRYHTQDEINSYMSQEAQNHPDLVQKKTLGTSAQGREISYVIVAKGTPSQSIYINGTHHGDEWSATESTLALIDYLISNKDTPEVSQVLTNYAVYIQPLVNPDGHQAKTREDSFGNDPNRDYSFSGDSMKFFGLGDTPLKRLRIIRFSSISEKQSPKRWDSIATFNLITTTPPLANSSITPT